MNYVNIECLEYDNITRDITLLILCDKPIKELFIRIKPVTEYII